MTRDEVIRRITQLADSLEADLEFCQTRDQHLRQAQRIAEARALAQETAAA